MTRSLTCLTSEEVIQNLITLAPHTEIAEHHQGKIRLKLLMSGLKVVKNIDFDALARCIPGLLSMNVKMLSRSVVIDYDPKRLPSDLWEDLVQIRHKPDTTPNVRGRLQDLLGQESSPGVRA